MAIEGATTDRKNYWVTKVLPKIHLVRGWARNGLTNDEIASNLGISMTTFYRFAIEHDQMKETLRSAREDAEIIMENALYKRGIGFKYREVTRERRQNEETEDWEMVITKTVSKNVVGDVGAQTYWLEHRAPRRWEKNVSPEINPDAVNNMINNLAQLLGKPVKPRPVGSEID